jgi:hypothetical protein
MSKLELINTSIAYAWTGYFKTTFTTILPISEGTVIRFTANNSLFSQGLSYTSIYVAGSVNL